MRRSVIAGAIAAALALAGSAFGQQPAPQCHFVGAGPLVAPDSVCTPGVVEHRPTRAEACDPALHPRDYIPAATRRAAISRYGLDPGTFDGELDHRIPVFLLGEGELGNLWPERGALPNLKDRLEFRVFRRVCFADPLPLSPRVAVRIFRRDWRVTYLLWRERGIL